MSALPPVHCEPVTHGKDWKSTAVTNRRLWFIMGFFGSLGHDRFPGLVGHCVQCYVSLFVCASVHMAEVRAQMNSRHPSQRKEQQLWSCGCNITTAVTAGICLPPRGTHFVPLILLPFPLSLNDCEINVFPLLF